MGRGLRLVSTTKEDPLGRRQAVIRVKTQYLEGKAATEEIRQAMCTQTLIHTRGSFTLITQEGLIQTYSSRGAHSHKKSIKDQAALSVVVGHGTPFFPSKLTRTVHRAYSGSWTQIELDSGTTTGLKERL